MATTRGKMSLMILIPKPVFTQYLNFLKVNNVPVGYHSEYVKWVRYFLDYCVKHVITRDKSERAGRGKVTSSH